MIKDVTLFKHFTEKEKRELAELAPPFMELEKGEMIIKEGELSTTLFLLVSGGCLITKEQDGANIRLSKLSAGELFGEMSWVSGKPRQSNVVTKEKSIVIKMDEEFFKKLTPEMSLKIKDFLIELLIKRLDKMNEAIMRISKLMRS